MGLYEKGTFPVSGGRMDYISFGSGFPLLIIPGLGDGLVRVGKSALQLYLYYRDYGKKGRIIIASRPEPVKQGSTTREMAAEYAHLMDHLGFSNFNVLGLSMGGMIAQYLAADYPEKVKKTVFAVTVPRADKRAKGVVSHWVELAEKNRYKDLLIDTNLKTFQEPRASRYARLISILGTFYRPRDLSRFIIQGQACLDHDARDILGKIESPALVISGEKDLITSPELGQELHQSLENSSFELLKGVGHGGFEERKQEFSRLIWDFYSNRSKEE